MGVKLIRILNYEYECVRIRALLLLLLVLLLLLLLPVLLLWVTHQQEVYKMQGSNKTTRLNN